MPDGEPGGVLRERTPPVAAGDTVEAGARPRARVLVVDPIDAATLATLHRDHDVQVSLRPDPSSLRNLVRDADVVVLRSGVTLDAEVLAGATHLKVIARAGSGTDNIDLEAARQRGVITFNVPAASAPAVAELALGLMIAAARHIALADRQVRNGIWRKAELGGSELGGKTLGLFGLGRIGSRIATVAQALDMRVVATVREAGARRREDLRRRDITVVGKNELLERADVVCLAVPLDRDTRHLIDAAALARMKRTALLINVSRGLTVDEDALFEALSSRRIAAAGIDVVAEERRPTRLTELDNIVITPHLGAMTHDAQSRIGAILVRGIAAALNGDEVPGRCT
jgi:D-3-phosphoglycerate dehydrogenase